MQRVLVLETLPESGIEASAEFMAEHLGAVKSILDRPDTEALAILLPPAPRDHDDWRRALARDLARAYAPSRVNVVGGTGEAAEATLAYLANAPGVTGQYCPCHEQ
ncbi:Rossmann fold domain-containing protein [Erythrobacter sp. THAF29]|uniref:Rossmann fold domain-containing protein n=1 Tax=Erythrobacter sp. THAF29 TaxID=2587851 RepID=UPI0012681ACB|nr:hypothetical protein [Erythrobacter sp. THAF29]QFT77267.1 hypothetical protein FIU90_06905 [Erythrobacter sp. THAF29]